MDSDVFMSYAGNENVLGSTYKHKVTCNFNSTSLFEVMYMAVIILHFLVVSYDAWELFLSVHERQLRLIINTNDPVK